MKFDPNGPAIKGSGVFGLPDQEKDAEVIYIPVPWEVTTSYGGGTSKAPQAILKASAQQDLFDSEVIDAYQVGYFMQKENPLIQGWNKMGSLTAKKVIHAAEQGKSPNTVKKELSTVNQLSEKMNKLVYQQVDKVLSQNKTAVVVGGDHSTPLGAIQAYGKYFQEFGILHFDAHMDLRNAYEGFTYSHASIMRNVVDTVPQLKKLIQVGIRDFCQEEVDYTQQHSKKIHVHYDYKMRRELYSGKSWIALATQIASQLPQNVYISFDIDGLDPKLCPHTGTPVPGGLEFDQALEIIRQVVYQGKRIIGFDLNEVSPSSDKSDEWDCNVGMRMLYKITNLMMVSQKKATLRP